MRREIGRGLLVFSVLAVSVAGCGSDSDDTMTLQEFRDEANAICAADQQEIGEALGAALGSPDPSSEQLQGALDTLVSAGNESADEIAALDAPASIEDDVDELVAELRTANDDAAAQGLAFWESEDDPWAHVNELAVGLGLDVCAADG